MGLGSSSFSQQLAIKKLEEDGKTDRFRIEKEIEIKKIEKEIEMKKLDNPSGFSLITTITGISDFNVQVAILSGISSGFYMIKVGLTEFAKANLAHHYMTTTDKELKQIIGDTLKIKYQMSLSTLDQYAILGKARLLTFSGVLPLGVAFYLWYKLPKSASTSNPSNIVKESSVIK